MSSADEIRDEVADLVSSKFPTSGKARIEVRESLDSDGEPSFKIRVIFDGEPSPDEVRYQRSSLVDELRTWLSEHGDDRFPYISFTTEHDEREKEILS